MAQRNELVLLETVLSERRAQAPSRLNDSEFFEFFAFDQILKDYELSDEELLEGQLGGGDEGGVDGVFVFEDDRLLDEDPDFSSARKGVHLTLFVIQAKRKDSFGETALQKVSDALADALDLSKSRDDLIALGLYHERFVERFEIFRDAVRKLANRRPAIKVVVAYASRGATDSINPKVSRRAELLEAQIVSALPQASAEVVFSGARELYELSQHEPSDELELSYQGTPQSDAENGYVALVKLEDYYSFLTDNGTLRRYIFEGNVRDFQGRVEVNEAIRLSLEDAEAPQFWWLNNGVTIVCEEASLINQRFYLRNPLVVNGLQTSMVIHSHFSGDSARRGQTGLLLVRVIQTTDSAARDRVIRSTNSQTSVPAASLRATDVVQRDIEQFFLAHGWFYDRRKSFYKNQGKPADRIISIAYLAQSLMAIGRRQPDDARGRPSSLLKDDDRYAEIFDPNLDLDIYLWAAKTQRAGDAFLRSDRAATSPAERTNLRFHLSMLAVARALGRPITSPFELRPLVETTLSDDDFASALDLLRESLSEYHAETGLPMERIAKSREFVTYLISGHFEDQADSARVTASSG